MLHSFLFRSNSLSASHSGDRGTSRPPPRLDVVREAARPLSRLDRLQSSSSGRPRTPGPITPKHPASTRPTANGPSTPTQASQIARPKSTLGFSSKFALSWRNTSTSTCTPVRREPLKSPVRSESRRGGRTDRGSLTSSTESVLGVYTPTFTPIKPSAPASSPNPRTTARSHNPSANGSPQASVVRHGYRKVDPRDTPRTRRIHLDWRVEARSLEGQWRECLLGAECLSVFDPLEGLMDRFQLVHTPRRGGGARQFARDLDSMPVVGSHSPSTGPAYPSKEALILHDDQRSAPPTPRPSSAARNKVPDSVSSSNTSVTALSGDTASYITPRSAQRIRASLRMTLIQAPTPATSPVRRDQTRSVPHNLRQRDAAPSLSNRFDPYPSPRLDRGSTTQRPTPAAPKDHEIMGSWMHVSHPFLSDQVVNSDHKASLLVNTIDLASSWHLVTPAQSPCPSPSRDSPTPTKRSYRPDSDWILTSTPTRL